VVRISKRRAATTLPTCLSRADRFLNKSQVFWKADSDMGMRGPQRNPNSVRGRREIAKKQKLAVIGKVGKGKISPAVEQIGQLPTCPKWLSKPVAEKWTSLVTDMAAAGVPLQQLDSRSIAVAAGYEADLDALESYETEDADIRLQSIRLKNATRKELLAALIAIGGTPVARLRARIAPEEKKKPNDDPWGSL